MSQTRTVTVRARGRMHTLFEHCYDGYATDVATGIQVESRHWKSASGAKNHAVEKLKQELVSRGIIPTDAQMDVVQKGEDTFLLNISGVRVGGNIPL